MLYSEKVQDLFLNPHNLGEIKDADGIGEVGNAKCGDIMKIWIKVNPETEVIENITFKTFGCAAAIATSSDITDMAKGLTVYEAEKITNQQVADDLGGLPPAKMHCSNLAADALKKAIEDYRNKKKDVQNNVLEDTDEQVDGLISKDMTIADIIEKYPLTIELFSQFGFHCLGCQMSSIETLEEGSMKHGIDVDEILDSLNGVIH